MEYKGYLSHIRFDDEANIFHGEVVNIRDVVTFQGSSVDELRQAFIDSIEDYLGFCKERGEMPNLPYLGRFIIQISPEQHKKIAIAAEKAGKNIEEWISQLLENAV